MLEVDDARFYNYVYNTIIEALLFSENSVTTNHCPILRNRCNNGHRKHLHK
jgi:hypothetical protein